MTDILKRDWVWERHKWTLENFTSGFPSSNKGVVIVPPSSLGGSSEPKNSSTRITSILPDLLSPDKKTILTSKLQSYKKALTEYPELVKRSKVLQVWERNQTKLTTFITEVKEATEEQLAKETDKSKKKDCQTTITKLTNLLNEISGLNLGKEELKEIISERIDDYDWGEAENKINTKIGKDWKDAIDESTADNFNTLKSNLLKMLAEIILDYYLTNTSKKPKERLEIIDNYLTEATRGRSSNGNQRNYSGRSFNSTKGKM